MKTADSKVHSHKHYQLPAISLLPLRRRKTRHNNSRNTNMNDSLTITKTKHSVPTQSQACAACKYQRRKCSKDCPLAPYFPSGGDNNEDFMNVHKLFGVSKISKLLKRVGLENRDEAVKSVVFEANARKADPVDGCYGIVLGLMKQIAACEAELQMVMHQVRAFRVLAAGLNESNVVEGGVRMKNEELRFFSLSNQEMSSGRISAGSGFAECLPD